MILSTTGLSAVLALAATNPIVAPGTSAVYRVHILRDGQQVPVKDVYVTVTASRSKRPQSETDSGTKKTAEDLKKFGGGGGDVKNAAKSTAGVAEDSAGQIHVRGEHTDITYVIDGTPLPDTLSGRQGALVVPATVKSLDIILGGFAPEFGIQAAAILDIATLTKPTKTSQDLELGIGSTGERHGQLTLLGPVGEKFGYVVNIGSHATDISSEAQQPDNQDAHNHGEDQNFFTKFMLNPSPQDRIALTLSTNPSKNQIGNRTGLGSTYAIAGQGYGFLGMRNRDGSVPGVDPTAPIPLGGNKIVLGSQQDEGMDINQTEQNEYAMLSWRHQFDEKSVAQLAFVLLHAGQDVTNNNPGQVDVTNLPVDKSTEFNPNAARNAHHVQVSGSLSTRSGPHSLKAGFIYDKQSGEEHYQIVPQSQLALDGLAASAPSLAPAGHLTGAVDVYGNPVYVASSNVSPTLYVQRSGFYAGAYLQDTWKLSKKLTANYGFRFDKFNQSQNLGQPTVDDSLISPRLNLSYATNSKTVIRASYDKVFNTPPLAQGAILDSPLEPEIVDQYDLGIEHQITPHQSVKLAYYAKDIRNQVDVGLLIPGSEIGLYTGVNFQRSGVHGVELSYEFSAPNNIGWDGFLNYTYSQASPNGQDNLGQNVPDYNDHDLRQNVSAGLSYTFPSGSSAAITMEHGSGLASSIVPPSTDRTPLTEFGLHLDSGNRLFNGNGGLSLDVTNLFDDRTVLNFQSGFSGTRFQTGRQFALTAHYRF